jgi:hypothetical protein
MRSGRRPVPRGGRSLPTTLTTAPLKRALPTSTPLQTAAHARSLVRAALDIRYLREQLPLLAPRIINQL